MKHLLLITLALNPGALGGAGLRHVRQVLQRPLSIAKLDNELFD